MLVASIGYPGQDGDASVKSDLRSLCSLSLPTTSMKFVYSLLAFGLLGLGAHAAATPYKCESVSKPAYLVSFGPMGQNTYLKVGQNQTEQHHPLIVQAGSTAHNADKFVLYTCHAHDSRLPAKFSLVRAAKDSSQCLSLNGPGPKKDDTTPVSKLDALSNSLVVKPCASSVHKKIYHQIFTDEQETSFPMLLEQKGTDDYATRSTISYKKGLVIMTPNTPPAAGSPTYVTRLYLNDE